MCKMVPSTASTFRSIDERLVGPLRSDERDQLLNAAMGMRAVGLPPVARGVQVDDPGRSCLGTHPRKALTRELSGQVVVLVLWWVFVAQHPERIPSVDDPKRSIEDPFVALSEKSVVLRGAHEPGVVNGLPQPDLRREGRRREDEHDGPRDDSRPGLTAPQRSVTFRSR